MSPLFLSRLALNPLRREVQRDLADCHNMHRRLLLAFPDLPDVSSAREHFGLLYRVEPTHGASVVLAQSRQTPDWTRLPSGYLAQAPDVKSITALYESLRPGMEFAFRLHANPTRRISNRNTDQHAQWRGKRVNLVQEADQIAWLTRKGATVGFTLLAIRALPLGLPRDHVESAALAAPASVAAAVTVDTRARSGGVVTGKRAGAAGLTFGSVLFEGRLRVTDVEAFRQALTQGIGSGKAYGFGLLSIAPVPSRASD